MNEWMFSNSAQTQNYIYNQINIDSDSDILTIMNDYEDIFWKKNEKKNNGQFY